LKRCPQCNRVEADDALVFCRTDGAALVTSPPASESSTAQLDASEVHTSILPHNTDASFKRVTGPTTSLPATSLPATSLPATDFRFSHQPVRRKSYPGQGGEELSFQSPPRFSWLESSSLPIHVPEDSSLQRKTKVSSRLRCCRLRTKAGFWKS
jgi:hypothetical protein